MPECVIIASAKISAGKKRQLHQTLNKTFCPTPPPHNPSTIKAPPKNKINKTIFSVSASSLFPTQTSQYQN